MDAERRWSRRVAQGIGTRRRDSGLDRMGELVGPNKAGDAVVLRGPRGYADAGERSEGSVIRGLVELSVDDCDSLRDVGGLVWGGVHRRGHRPRADHRAHSKQGPKENEGGSWLPRRSSGCVTPRAHCHMMHPGGPEGAVRHMLAPAHRRHSSSPRQHLRHPGCPTWPSGAGPRTCVQSRATLLKGLNPIRSSGQVNGWKSLGDQRHKGRVSRWGYP